MKKTYRVDIASHRGHESLLLQLTEAVETIVTNTTQKALWLFINSQKFEFVGSNHRSAENIERLTQTLEPLEDPIILLTGELRGGRN